MKFSIVLFLLLPLFTMAQNASSPFEKVEIVEVKDLSQDQLFDRAVHFINSHFNDTKEVVQTKVRASGTIYLKAIFRLSEFDLVHFSMNIAVKDGKYKYEIKDLSHEGHGGGYSNVARVEKVGGILAHEKPDCKMPGRHWKKIQAFGMAQIDKLAISFKEGMNEKSFNDF